MPILTLDDLTPFVQIDPAKAEAMIADAEAMAATVAPCTTNPDFLGDPARVGAVKAILRAAVLRWEDSGSGALASESYGPFSKSMDTRTDRRGMFWPSEIGQLQDICAAFTGATGTATAFEVDTLPMDAYVGHDPACAIRWGAGFCSCGFYPEVTPFP